MHTELYRHLVDRVDDEDRCSRSPGDIDDLRSTEEVDLEFMLALKALTQTYQRSEEGMVIGLELEGAGFGQDLSYLAFVDEEGALTRSDDELATVLDFIKRGGEAIPEIAWAWISPLDDLRQLPLENIE